MGCIFHNSHLDRLPDDILLHILSFMSTKDCVRSSALAKRWRFLWACVPNLKFDSGDHKTLRSFSNFFNRFVFTHKGQNINSFRLEHYEYSFEDEDDEDVEGSENKKFEEEDDEDMLGSEYKFEIETLIVKAIACNVQIIDIHENFGVVLPHCLFICKTLVDLTLNRIFLTLSNFPMDPMTSTSVFLPSLKKLQLRMVFYESEESLVLLLSGCPALEELTILKEKYDNVVCVNVSSPTLTRLDLEIDKNDSYNKNLEVKLDTPALKYLRLYDYLSRDFSAGMLASLTEADVFLAGHLFGHPDSVFKFVGNLNNVSCLKLTTGSMEVDDSAFSALTIEFRNLTKLELAGNDWRFVTYFLENSDNLEFLTIGEFYDLENRMEPKQVPACLIHHLGKVRFDKFNCSEKEFSMVEYILRNAKILKRMEICPYNSQYYSKKNSEARKRISLFERASEACQLAFD